MAPGAQIPVDPSAIELAIPLAELQAEHPETKLVVGVAILRRNASSAANGPSASASNCSQILIVRRAPHEVFYPSMWELPGGGVETAEDASLIATAIRETKEETGLTISRVLRAFDGFSYTSGSGRVNLQFNFVVEVEGGTVELNADEHDQHAWIAHGDDLDAYAMTREMRVVVEDALRIVASF